MSNNADQPKRAVIWIFIKKQAGVVSFYIRYKDYPLLMGLFSHISLHTFPYSTLTTLGKRQRLISVLKK